MHFKAIDGNPKWVDGQKTSFFAGDLINGDEVCSVFMQIADFQPHRGKVPCGVAITVPIRIIFTTILFWRFVFSR